MYLLIIWLQERATIAETLQLSLTEANLVDMFRTLNKHDQENAFDFITMLYEKTTGARKSIYATYNNTNNIDQLNPETA